MCGAAVTDTWLGACYHAKYVHLEPKGVTEAAAPCVKKALCTAVRRAVVGRGRVMQGDAESE